MKFSKPSVAVIIVVLLSLGMGKLGAGVALASQTLAAAQTKAQRQCVSACRARYRDCSRFGQLPAFECWGIYQDCTRYSCTGQGPG